MYRDIKVTPPTQFEMDSIEHSVHYTYFDSTGRPAVTFYKKNVVTAHQQPLFVSSSLYCILLCLLSNTHDELGLIQVFISKAITKAIGRIRCIVYFMFIQHSCIKGTLGHERS
jgi:hypothetical protein